MRKAERLTAMTMGRRETGIGKRVGVVTPFPVPVFRLFFSPNPRPAVSPMSLDLPVVVGRIE